MNSRARDPFCDNVKWLLMALVVWGHFTGPLIFRDSGLRHIYVAVHFFHMPLFAFIAGRFASPARDRFTIFREAQRLLFPYALFQIFYSFLESALTHTELSLSSLFFTPHFHLWFLVSLFSWKLMLAPVSKIPFPFAAAVILGLAAGLIPAMGRTLSLSRTLVFFPYFLAGWLLKDRDIRPSRRAGLVVAAGSLCLLTAPILVASFPNFSYRWIFGCYSYEALQTGWASGTGIRIFLYGAGFLLGASFLCLVPRGRTLWTEAGKRTMTIYLLHVFILKAAKAAGIYTAIDQRWEKLLLVPAAILAAWVLSLPAITKWFSPLVEPGNRL